jgi:PAS domain-containing protein
VLDKGEVYDLIPGLVIVTGLDHTILDLNELAARAAGKPRNDCIGAKVWDLFNNPGCRAGTCAAAQELAPVTAELQKLSLSSSTRGASVAGLQSPVPRRNWGPMHIWQAVLGFNQRLRPASTKRMTWP